MSENSKVVIIILVFFVMVFLSLWGLFFIVEMMQGFSLTKDEPIVAVSTPPDPCEGAPGNNVSPPYQQEPRIYIPLRFRCYYVPLKEWVKPLRIDLLNSL